MNYRKKKHNKKKTIFLSVITFILISLLFVFYKLYFTNMTFNEVKKDSVSTPISLTSDNIESSLKNTNTNENLDKKEELPNEHVSNFDNDLIKINTNYQDELNSIGNNYFLKEFRNSYLISNFIDKKLILKSVNNQNYSESKKCISIFDNDTTITFDIPNKELVSKNGRYKNFFIDFFILQDEENEIELNLKWKNNKKEIVNTRELLIPKLKNETEQKRWYYFCINLGKLDRKYKNFNEKKSLTNNNILIKKEILYHNLKLEIENGTNYNKNSNNIENKVFITPPKLYTIEKKAWYNKKKKNIIFFDIDNLTTEIIEKDSLILPNLYFLSRNGNYYKDCSSNSLNKELSITSYLTGFYASELYYKNKKEKLQKSEKKDFFIEKQIITKKIRDTTLPKLYKNSGYETYHISNINQILKNFNLIQDLGFSNISLLTTESNESENNDEDDNNTDLKIVKNNKLILNLLETKLNISNDYSKKNIFMHIVLESKTEKQLKLIDNLLGNIINKFNSSANTFIFTSSHNQLEKNISNKDSFEIKKKPVIFYNSKGITNNISNFKINFFDITKTIIAYSALSLPPYYPGKNLLKLSNKQYEGREFIIREKNNLSKSIESKDFYYNFSSEDNSYLEILWKKIFDSDTNSNNIFYNVKNKRNLFNSVINRFRLKLHENNPADFIKKITLYNDSENIKEYKIELISKHKFIPFDNIANYYILKKNRKRNRYIEKITITVAPNKKEDFLIFFRKKNQKFLFKFKEKNSISYGENWIYAGEKNRFEEESQLGFSYNLQINKKLTLSSNVDIHIINYDIGKN